MKNALSIAGREIRAYFVSPVAYVVMTGFLLLSGWFFFSLLARFNYHLQLYTSFQNPQALERLNLNELVIAPLLHNLSVVLIILIPVITMRTFAEERRLGTFELLLTSPVGIGEIVAGKFLGAFAFLSATLGMTAIYPLITVFYGDPEIGMILSGYLGLFLLATSFLSIGLLTSSLTENQTIAAVSCLVTLLLLYVLAWPADTAGETLGAILRHLSITDHYAELVKGVIDTRNLAYFVSLIFVSLFLTHRSVESLRWR